MNCTYCGCPREGTEKLNNWPYCDIHFEMLSKVKVVDKVRGHMSRYEVEDELEENVDNKNGEE